MEITSHLIHNVPACTRSDANKAMVDWNAICLCHGVHEPEIRAAIRAGARDVDAVGRACMAGRYCGGCRTTIRRLIREEMLRPGPSAPPSGDAP